MKTHTYMTLAAMAALIATTLSTPASADYPLGVPHRGLPICHGGSPYDKSNPYPPSVLRCIPYLPIRDNAQRPYYGVTFTFGDPNADFCKVKIITQTFSAYMEPLPPLPLALNAVVGACTQTIEIARDSGYTEIRVTTRPIRYAGGGDGLCDTPIHTEVTEGPCDVLHIPGGIGGE